MRIHGNLKKKSYSTLAKTMTLFPFLLGLIGLKLFQKPRTFITVNNVKRSSKS